MDDMVHVLYAMILIWWNFLLDEMEKLDADKKNKASKIMKYNISYENYKETLIDFFITIS